ncbi:MAG: hypothetical protein A2Z35_01400 [Actinobacteria bacterium RBG_19FT_COMBO_36_27]|nr:MAG: hypothetical protein A2Z35_01400 [Actinobacteria bacterium RBG_19FT_COMBO_36_27]
MAALVSHIPGRGGQAIRYYGFHSNVARGRLKKQESLPEFHIIEDESPRSLNRSWQGVRMLPLHCPDVAEICLY